MDQFFLDFDALLLQAVSGSSRFIPPTFKLPYCFLIPCSNEQDAQLLGQYHFEQNLVRLHEENGSL